MKSPTSRVAARPCTPMSLLVALAAVTPLTMPRPAAAQPTRDPELVRLLSSAETNLSGAAGHLREIRIEGEVQHADELTRRALRQVNETIAILRKVEPEGSGTSRPTQTRLANRASAVPAPEAAGQSGPATAEQHSGNAATTTASSGQAAGNAVARAGASPTQTTAGESQLQGASASVPSATEAIRHPAGGSEPGASGREGGQPNTVPAVQPVAAEAAKPAQAGTSAGTPDAGGAAAGNATATPSVTGGQQTRTDANGAGTAQPAGNSPLTPDAARQFVGEPALDANGQMLGHLSDITKGPDGHMIAVVTYGGFLGFFQNHKAIPWQEARPYLDGGHLSFHMTPTQLQEAPRYAAK